MADQVKLNPFTGQFDLTGSGGGISIGETVAGADINSVLLVDSLGQLADSGTMTDGQLIIGKTGSPPARALPSGTANQVIITPGSGTLTFGTPQDIAPSSNVAFASVMTPVIDSATTLTIGGTTATIINIGNSTSVLNFTGTVNNNNVTNLNVADKLFTVNSGGGVGSGSDSGFEIEENAVITGFFKTTATRDGFRFKAPATPEFDLSSTALTATRTLTVPDASGIIVLDTTIATLAANRSLSNLTNPTAINQSLLFNADNTYDIGTPTNRVANLDAIWLRGGTGQPFIALGSGGVLFDSTATISVHWDQRYLKDNADVFAMRWTSTTRALINAAAATVLDWTGANPSLNTHKLINVVDPTAAQDAATKNYVDTLGATYANKSLSNLTNPTSINQSLVPDSDAVRSLGSFADRWNTVATIFVKSDSADPYIGLGGSAALFDNTATPSLTWGSRRLNDSSGAEVFNWSGPDLHIVGTHKITNLTDPTSAQDAATKNYVDTAIPLASANRTLSNLTSPIALNQNLKPDIDLNQDLGSNTFRFNNIYTRFLKNSATSASIDVLSAYLKDAGNLVSVGWSLRNLIDTTGNVTVDWQLKQLLDSTGIIKLDWSGTNLDINTRKIINVVDPTANQDAATKLYVDTSTATAANKTLSNLTSPTAINQNLLPDSDSTRSIGSSLLKFQDIFVNHIRTTNTNGIDIANNLLLDSGSNTSIAYGTRELLNSSGTTIASWVSTFLDLNTHLIKNVVDPVSAQDAATKNYVDSRTLAKSPGDLAETSFAGANNIAAPTNITGFLFANATVRSFDALVSVYVNATGSLYETFTLRGVQRGADWAMSVESTGDNSLVAFTITTAGQIQYTDANYPGFTGLTIKYRAITTSV